MKVLLISYLPPTLGGIATWAGILRDQGSHGKHSFRFVEMSADSDPRYPRWTNKAWRSAILVARVAYKLFRERPDVVHLNCCHSPMGVWRDLVVAAVVCARQVPLVVHYHGSLPDVFDRFSLPSRIGLKWLIKSARVNIGITRGSVSLLERQSSSGKTAYLPNFIEDEWLNRSSIGEGGRAPESRLQAIYAGRLSRDKGVLDLLRVARIVPQVDFLLVGETREDVKAAFASAPANVTALPALSRRQVMELLFRSDVFVFPSLRPHEGFPNAVLEAMAAGLPVISTRVGALGEMIDEGLGGWLLAPGDVDGLADAVRRLVSDTQLARRSGTHNQRVCREKFRFSCVFGDLSELYDRFASKSPGTALSSVPDAPLAAWGVDRQVGDP